MTSAVNEKRERLLEVATLLLAGSTGQRMQTTNLNKALFYVDLASLRDFGETLTGNSYVALPEGPVVAKYPQRLIKPLEQRGLARQETEGQSKPVVLLNRATPQLVSDAACDLINRVAVWCGERTAKSLSDFSHQNPGWIIAYADGLGGGGSPQLINLHIAMQQIMDEDPWLSQPLDDAEAAAIARADQGTGSQW